MRRESDLAEFLDVENYELTRQDPFFRTYASPISDYYLISYNLADPFMSDRKVRLAIAHALDKKNLIRHLEKGYGAEAAGPFGSRSWAFNPEVKPFPYDPAAALDLLKEAGWKDTDGDDIQDKAGKKLVIRMLVHERNEKLKRMAMFIRQNLQEIGVKLEICLYDNVNDIARLMSSGMYQSILTFFPAPSFDPNEIIKFWHSADQRTRQVQAHLEPNSELDRLIRLGAVTSDRTTRQKIYRDIHRIIYEEQPACFLYFPFNFHAVSKRFANTDEFLGSPYMPDHYIKNFIIDDHAFMDEGGGE